MRKEIAGDGDGAPAWLWNGVVALAGGHEVGYLDHCRRHLTGG